MPWRKQPRKENLFFGRLDDAFEARRATFDDPARLSHDDVQKLVTTEREEYRNAFRYAAIAVSKDIRRIQVARTEKGRYFNLFNSLHAATSKASTFNFLFNSYRIGKYAYVEVSLSLYGIGYYVIC